VLRGTCTSVPLPAAPGDQPCGSIPASEKDKLSQSLPIGKSSCPEGKTCSEIGLYAVIAALPLTALTQVIIQEPYETFGFFSYPILFALSYGPIQWSMKKRSQEADMSIRT